MPMANVRCATGSVIVFDGFLSVYREDRDETDNGAQDDDKNRILPPMASGDPIRQIEVKPEQHFTQPPPLHRCQPRQAYGRTGYGRPSTYANTLSKLQDRHYVIKDRGALSSKTAAVLFPPSLESFFTRYVEYGFTARLEEDLDRVSDGKLEWKSLLRDFWKDFKAQVDSMDDLSRGDVLEQVDTLLEQHFFPSDDNGTPMRTCQHCSGGTLGLKWGVMARLSAVQTIRT